MSGGSSLPRYIVQNAEEVGGNMHGALDTIGENAGHIKQWLARLKGLDLP